MVMMFRAISLFFIVQIFISEVFVQQCYAQKYIIEL
jgi:hypothetical protein